MAEDIFDDNGSVASKRERWLKYNEDLDRLFVESRNEWNSRVEPLYDGIVRAKPEEVTTLEASSLGLRQNITEEIAYFKSEMAKNMEKSREIRRDKIMEYVRPGQKSRDMVAALNSKHTDRKILLAGELAFLERTVEMYKLHLEFLIETREVLKSYSYAIKNKLEAAALMINR